jgi:hypothetical protein
MVMVCPSMLRSLPITDSAGLGGIEAQLAGGAGGCGAVEWSTDRKGRGGRSAAFGSDLRLNTILVCLG